MLTVSGTDQMSLSQTTTFFSLEVSSIMRALEYKEKTQWCTLCHNFIVASDDRGTPAVQRMQYMAELHRKLRTNYPQFSIVSRDKLPNNGPPWDLVGATLQAAQGRVFLYGLTGMFGYSTRAFSSINVEHFRGWLNQQDHRNVQKSSTI